MGRINIEGVNVLPLKIIQHPKGDIYHGVKKNDYGFGDFGEVYFSSINPGAIKAWKKHYRMTSNLICPVGKVLVVMYDARADSGTSNNYQDVILGEGEHYRRLIVPPGIWTGFKSLHEGFSLLMNVANIEHDPSEQINVDISKFEYNWNKGK